MVAIRHFKIQRIMESHASFTQENLSFKTYEKVGTAVAKLSLIGMSLRKSRAVNSVNILKKQKLQNSGTE